MPTTPSTATTTTRAETTTTTTAPTTTTTTQPPLLVVVETDPRIFLQTNETSFCYVFDETLADIGAAPSNDCRSWH